MAVLRQHAGHLVQEFEGRLQTAERAKEEKELKNAQRLAKRAAKAQAPKGPSLTHYFPQVYSTLVRAGLVGQLPRCCFSLVL